MAGKIRDRLRAKHKRREKKMEVAKIEIVITPDGQVKYHSNMPPPITVFYLEFVKTDLVTRNLKREEQSSIVIPQIIPPARPEG